MKLTKVDAFNWLRCIMKTSQVCKMESFMSTEHTKNSRTALLRNCKVTQQDYAKEIAGETTQTQI
jgi:hypothetical protein